MYSSMLTPTGVESHLARRAGNGLCGIGRGDRDGEGFLTCWKGYVSLGNLQAAFFLPGGGGILVIAWGGLQHLVHLRVFNVFFNTVPFLKLTCPLKINTWKIKYPFEKVPFQGNMLIFRELLSM